MTDRASRRGITCLLLVGVGLGLVSLLSDAGLAAAERTTFKDCAVCPEMVTVSEHNVAENSKKFSLHAVGRYEVTFDEWNKCVEAGICVRLPASNYPTSGRHPATNMTWLQASDYVRWLSNKTV